MKIGWNFVKPTIALLVLWAVLRFTGIMGTVTSFTQAAVLETGLVNAGYEPLARRDPFNYNFIIKDLDGNRIPFEQYKGKVIFLNLWATWCGPCRGEMAGIQKLYNKVDHENIAFVMLSLDTDDNREKVVTYKNKHTFSFPIFQPSGYLSDQLTVPSIPTTFIVSKSGEIVMKEVGMTNFNTEKFKTFLEGLNK